MLYCSGERLHIITTLHTLLVNSHALSSPFLPNRLVKALLPALAVMLEAKSQGDDTKNAITGNGSKKSRKRARDMEGDQVLRTTTSVAYPTKQDGETALATLDGKCLVSRIDDGPLTVYVSSQSLAWQP